MEMLRGHTDDEKAASSSSSSSFETANGDLTVDYSSESSSSIGTPGETDEEEESEGEDKKNDDVSLGLASLASLEDSLPSKKGLSNHYKGKSKSFGNLGEIESVEQVEKQENPLNKKRRLQICNKLARKSFYSWANPKSLPLFPVNENEDEEEDEDMDDENKSSSSDEEKGKRRGGVGVVVRRRSFKNRALKSRSCFALSDLQEEEDDQ